jgi:NNP family nitrate/nitrite transporter-like MFS transporter
MSKLVPLFALAHLSHHLILAMLGPLWPAIRDQFGIDYTRFGFLLAAFGIAQGVSNLPWGWLADRIGQRVLVLAGISGVALAGLMIGLAESYTMMLVGLILLGIVSGAYHVAAVPIITRSVSPQKKGSALGLHMIGSSTCFLAAPLIAVAIAGVWTWRAPLIILSIPIFAFGIYLYILLRRFPLANRAESGPKQQAQTGQTVQGLNWSRLLPLLILSIVGVSLSQAPQSFLSLFLVDRYGASQATVALFLTVISAGGLIAGPLGGYLSDRFGATRVLLAGFLLCAPLIYLLNWAPFPLPMLLAFLLISMVNYVRMPVTEMYIMNHTPERYRSTMLGAYYFAGNEVLSGFTPVAGFMIDCLDFHMTFTILSAAVFLLVLVLSFWLLSKGPDDYEAR